MPWKSKNFLTEDDDLDFSSSGPLKLIRPLRGGQHGMQNGNAFAEMPVKTHQRLVGQSDLRDQDNGLSAPL